LEERVTESRDEGGRAGLFSNFVVKRKDEGGDDEEFFF
jgi:hypothetical protein